MDKKPQQKVYNNVENDLQRTSFDLGYSNRFTCNFGKMIPTCLKEVMPKDSFRMSTDFWSRFLPLQAPVFQKIDFRFNNFFVPNELIWKGWSQFFGDGDGQSADYLLSKETKLASSKVPYITTKKYAQLLGDFSYKDVNGVHRFYGNQGWLSVGRKSADLDTQDYRYSIYCYMEGLKAYYVPFLCSNRVRLGHLDTSNDPLLSRICLMLLPDNDLTKKYESDGLILCAHGVKAEEFYKWHRSEKIYNGNTVFVYKNFQLTEDIVEDHNYIYVDYDWIGLSYYNYGVRVASVSDGVGDNPWDSEDFTILVDPMNDMEVHVNYDSTTDAVCDYVFSIDCNSGTPEEVEEYGAVTWALVGSPFVIFSSDFSQNNGIIFGANGIDGYSQWYYLQVAPRLIAKYFGQGTLSDFFGVRKSQFGKRQDLNPDKANQFLTYQYIINSFNSSIYMPTVKGSAWFGENGKTGTYIEPTMDEIGVINDEPISLLPYLAYKKIWTDFIRDPRFELRDPYSDPYKSPFLIPMSDGTYVSGDVTQFINASMFNRDSYQIDTSCIFTYETLFTFFSLRERRIVQDGFTLMSPNSQYGDDVVVDLNSKTMDVYQGATPTASQQVYRFSDGTFGSGANVRYEMNSSFSIKVLRLMGRLQRYMEQKNFYGSDYIKEILAQYGVEPAHCQHCATVYLGGKTFNPSLQTTPMTGADSTATQQVTGQLSANLELNGSVPDFSFTPTEHGYVIQLLTVQNDFSNIQGIKPQRIDKFDFAIPQFGNLGMQEVKYSRVLDYDDMPWSQGSRQPKPDEVFAFEPRYADWKYSLDEAHGQMCSTLNYWISNRKFNPNVLGGLFGLGNSKNFVELGANFLYENPNYEAFAYNSDDEDHCIFDMHHNISCVRSLPMLPNPTIV